MAPPPAFDANRRRVEWDSQLPPIAVTVPEILERILNVLRALRAETRYQVVQEELRPLIADLRGRLTEDTMPALLKESLSTVELWAEFIATDSTSWRIYAERMAAHCRSVRILAQVQLMGRSSSEA